jgi:hypothetical protein
MFLDVEEIDVAVVTCLTDRVGAAAKWSQGLVADANASAFEPSHHVGNHELIGVGHSYFGVANRSALVENVFANIRSVRQRAGKPD